MSRFNDYPPMHEPPTPVTLPVTYCLPVLVQAELTLLGALMCGGA